MSSAIAKKNILTGFQNSFAIKRNPIVSDNYYSFLIESDNMGLFASKEEKQEKQNDKLRAKTAYLHAIMDQNWIMIKQLDKISKLLDK